MISSRSIASSAVLRKDYGNSFLLLEPFFGKIIFELRIPAAMNDPLEHATGVEKWELLEKQAGNEVNFYMCPKNCL